MNFSHSLRFRRVPYVTALETRVLLTASPAVMDSPPVEISPPVSPVMAVGDPSASTSQPSTSKSGSSDGGSNSGGFADPNPTDPGSSPDPGRSNPRYVYLQGLRNNLRLDIRDVDMEMIPIISEIEADQRRISASTGTINRAKARIEALDIRKAQIIAALATLDPENNLSDAMAKAYNEAELRNIQDEQTRLTDLKAQSEAERDAALQKLMRDQADLDMLEREKRDLLDWLARVEEELRFTSPYLP